MQYDDPLSNCAFNFNLRHYTTGDCIAHVPLMRWDHCSAVQERSEGAVDFPVPPFASLIKARLGPGLKY